MNDDLSTCEKKKQALSRKLMWGALGLLGIIILFVAVICICTEGSCSKKTKEERTVAAALRIRNGNAPLKILEVSKPDSVFYNRMCPEEELMDISERFLTYSMNIMQESQAELLAEENTAYRCKMDRYSTTSAALNTLNGMLDKPAGRHFGWRVKAKYQTVDDSGTPYVAETWFIFDKRKKHILNSFDICLL